MSFRIRGLPANEFADLLALTDTQLERRNARRFVAHDGSCPCRVSLTDAAVGETVVLVNYEHHRVASPFRASGAIYVREGEASFDAVDAVPEQLRRRLLALRGYDAMGMLQTGDIVAGSEIEAGIENAFASPHVAYIHAHFAKPGCYAALIERH